MELDCTIILVAVCIIVILICALLVFRKYTKQTQTKTRKKRKNRNQRKRNANKNDGVSQMHCKPKTVRDLMPYDAKYAELQKRAYWRSCWLCKAEGYNTKLCQGCGLVSYCGEDCKRRDGERHKHPCELVHNFNTAISKVDPEVVKNLHMSGYRKQMSCYLGSIPDRTRYEMLEGSRVCVVVEIVKIIPDPIIWKVLVRDITNHTAEITFNTFRNCATLGVTSYFFESLTLAKVLIPGNFLLLLNICWLFYEHKAANLIVEDLKLVIPIIMSNQEGRS